MKHQGVLLATNLVKIDGATQVSFSFSKTATVNMMINQFNL